MSAADRPPRRICYVIPSLNAGGTERQLGYLLKGLVGDHELTVVCTRTAGDFAGEIRRLGVVVRELPGWGGWDFSIRRRIRHVFRAHRPDILHTFLFGFDLPVNRAARETGVPVLISGRRELAEWMKARHLRMQRMANRYVDCVVANSNTVADFAREREGVDPELVRVIHNGVDADSFVSQTDATMLRQRYNVPEKRHVVGMVANFSPVKDHDLFLSIAGELARRRSDLHFLLVGTGPLRNAFTQKVYARNWQDRFTITSAVVELADLYALMDVCVLCSKREGFPNALIEAMAAGKPVVAAAVGGIPELVEDGVTGRLVGTRDPRAFADAIAGLLEDAGERMRLAAHARAYVREHLTVERMVSAHRALYTELLARSARRGA
jgi:glycosyltransferase involved in cell wall biosynthesis